MILLLKKNIDHHNYLMLNIFKIQFSHFDSTTGLMLPTVQKTGSSFQSMYEGLLNNFFERISKNEELKIEIIRKALIYPSYSRYCYEKALKFKQSTEKETKMGFYIFLGKAYRFLIKSI